MHKWFFSLQFRLVLGFAFVLALALGSVSLYVKTVAAREVERYQREVEEARTARVQEVLSSHYKNKEGWKEIGPVLEQAAALYNWQIIVRDGRGRVVGDSDRRFGKRPFGPGPSRGRRQLARIANQGRDVGEVDIALSQVPPTIPEPPVTRLLSALDQSLLMTGLAAGLGGILLVSLMSGRALNSVRALGVAARQLGQGDLSHRVPSLTKDEIGELGHTFNFMADSLEKAEQQRRSLVADVAHELRTPLSNIQGHVEAVSDGLLQPDNETIDTIRQQVLHLSHLVEDLRVLALAESGNLRLEIQPDSLDSAIQASVSAIRPRADAKSVSVVTEGPNELPPVRMDRVRIDQVLGNLLENAVRHTPDSGTVTVNTEPGDRYVRVAVTDTGPGIPVDDIPYVFERFYRVDPSRARTTGGAGLGLTIAKQLIEAHGGSIWVESKPGRGTKFVFELPIAGQHAEGEESTT